MNTGAKQIVSDAVRRYEGVDGKVLVFTRSIRECDQWATVLNCPSYHSKTVNCKQVLTDWTKGALIATTGLGAGVNITCMYGLDQDQWHVKGEKRGELTGLCVGISPSEGQKNR